MQPVKLYGHPFPAPAPLDEFLARYRYGPDYRVPRRVEKLAERTQIIPSVKRYLGRRVFHDRLRRNLSLLQETLDMTPFRGCYHVTMEPSLDHRATADDSPDAGFGYRGSDRALFLDALPALEAVGFSRSGDPRVGEGNCTRYRLSKEGACIDFIADEQPGGAA